MDRYRVVTLDDLPRRVVRPRERVAYDARYYRAPLHETDAEAYREMLAQAQECYRQALGCIRLMLKVKDATSSREAVSRMREIGREFMMLAEPRRFELPAGMRPRNQGRRGK